MSSSLIEETQVPDAATVQAFSPAYTPEAPRLSALDIMKGLAVSAGLFFSILYWGGVSKGMQGAAVMAKKDLTHVLQVAVSFLFEDKMRSLLLMAFGASSLLMLVRTHPGSKVSNQELLIRRNFFLLLLGIINGVLLLWPYDILYGLGIVGVIFFAFMRMPARGLLMVSLLTLAIACGKNYWHYHDDKEAYRKFLLVEAKEKKIKADSAKLKDSLKTGFRKTDTLTWKQQEEKGAWEGVSKKFKWERKNDSGKIRDLQDGRWVKVYNAQLRDTQTRESWWFYQFGFWQFAAALLLGMYLFKSGFFNGRYTGWQYLLMFASCFIIGFVLMRIRMHGWMDSIRDYTKFVRTKPFPADQFRPAEAMAMALGYASLVMWMIRVSWLRHLNAALATIGRMALSVYILQSILLGIFFYGFGMGYYARIPHNWLYFIALEMIIIQLAFSYFWTRYFYMGPVEWVVASLSKGRRQPFRRTASSSQQLQTV